MPRPVSELPQFVPISTHMNYIIQMGSTCFTLQGTVQLLNDQRDTNTTLNDNTDQLKIDCSQLKADIACKEADVACQAKTIIDQTSVIRSYQMKTDQSSALAFLRDENAALTTQVSTQACRILDLRAALQTIEGCVNAHK